MPVLASFNTALRAKRAPSVPAWVATDAYFRYAFEEFWCERKRMTDAFELDKYFEECVFKASKKTIRARRHKQQKVNIGIDRLTVILKVIHHFTDKARLKYYNNQYPFLQNCNRGEDGLPYLVGLRSLMDNAFLEASEEGSQPDSLLITTGNALSTSLSQ